VRLRSRCGGGPPPPAFPESCLLSGTGSSSPEVSFW
jgi:hypothetical protein